LAVEGFGHIEQCGPYSPVFRPTSEFAQFIGSGAPVLRFHQRVGHTPATALMVDCSAPALVAKTGAAVRDLLIISRPLPQPVGQPPILIGQVEQPSPRSRLVIAVGYVV